MFKHILKIKLNFLRFKDKVIFEASLSDIDEFYRNIVSDFSYFIRINYCESLIFRTIADIDSCCCRFQKKELELLLKASKQELDKLRAKNK
ncbi:hypothetical protein [Flavivirga spongiicola]|uniref:Uncharacterized protein n=1 Tax=Flavivirga spongiicola TaxID=421621 RepID=A0ABU7XX66_9FLAO|nr:hypothetical protein [Flavivirga sp. MEBiC05379]MDO5980376.1 hypothetical protein [Flavivirga sp. MEBiC05379]